MRRPHQRARYQKAAQLISSKQRLRHVSVAWHAGVSGVAQDRLDDSIGIAATAQNVRARKWMLIGRGKHFVIEVMKQTDKPPLVDISVGSTVTRRAPAHRSLNRQRMLPKALTLGVFAQQVPGFCSARHRHENDL